MNKNLTWKQELVYGAVCYIISRVLGDTIGILAVAFELGGLILIVLGVIGAIRALFKKKPEEKKSEE